MKKDYDVVVIGGGINGLTTAAYLAKAGLSVGLFEARGQCGAHCDTIELGLSGFLHNTHAAWLVPAMSPAMADLELERFGLDLLGTDVLFAKTFLSGKNVVQGLDSTLTAASIARASERDARTQAKISQYFMENAGEVLALSQQGLFSPPSAALLDRHAAFHDGLLRHLGLPLSGDDLQRMNGSKYSSSSTSPRRCAPLRPRLASSPASGRFTGAVGALALELSAFAPMPVHTARGGSHALTHALVKSFVASGGSIWTTCPVEKILGVAAVSLAVGLGGVMWQWRRAEAERARAEIGERIARQSAYAADMHLAGLAYAEGDRLLAGSLLDKHRPERKAESG